MIGDVTVVSDLIRNSGVCNIYKGLNSMIIVQVVQHEELVHVVLHLL